jgi:hypothetical protein
MARSYKRDSKGRFASTGGGGKLGKSAKNVGARAEFKAASRDVRVRAKQASDANTRGGVSKASRVRAGERLGTARTAKLKTELKLSGKKSELAALNKAEKRSEKIKNEMAAKKAVSTAKEKAKGTFRGKLAAVKRAITGSKRK